MPSPLGPLNTNAPAFKGAAITIADSQTDLTYPFRAVYVGVGGDISMKLVGDTGFNTYKNVPSGSILPFQAINVQAAGTTATNLIGLN